jgi:hypothetical protein
MGASATCEADRTSTSFFNVFQFQGDRQHVADVRTFDGPEDVLDFVYAETLATLGWVLPSLIEACL